MDEGLERCIDECLSCYRICASTVRHCLENGKGQAEATHVAMLLDCAEICRTSADFMLRASSLHGFTCSACAEICERCAEICERMDDDVVRQCAAACRRCAQSCRSMALAA
jgi:hypothetical protein